MVGNLHNKYKKKAVNTKGHNDKVLGHIHTKYDNKVKHYDKVVDKLNTKHSKKFINTMKYN